MLLVLFRSKLTELARDDYASMAEAMLERARGMPGFVDFTHYTSEDGERLSVIRWESEETLRAWRDDPRHREAQRAGRERWYQYFRIEVAEVVRAYGFGR